MAPCHSPEKAMPLISRVMLGLSGCDPVTIPVDDIQGIVNAIKNKKTLNLDGSKKIPFDPETQIRFHKKFLPFHANALTFEAQLVSGTKKSSTYYSIGGGFVVQKDSRSGEKNYETLLTFPYPTQNGDDLLAHCEESGKPISEIVLENELSLRSIEEIDDQLAAIWNVMLECMYTGCHTEGNLPGGLNVRRRAHDIYQKLKGELSYGNPEDWLQSIRKTEVKFRADIKVGKLFCPGRQ